MAVAGEGVALPPGREICDCHYERLGPDVLFTGEISRGRV